MKSSIQETLGPDYWKRHRLIYRSAKKHTVALCGSTAAALCRGNKEYKPSDIDFVCGSEANAMAFVADLCRVLNSGRSHYRLFFNARNKFCPPNVLLHIRFTSSLWLPICVFVLKPGKFKFFRGVAGLPIQMLDDVREAAVELTEIDGKERIAAEPDATGVEVPLGRCSMEDDDSSSNPNAEDGIYGPNEQGA